MIVGFTDVCKPRKTGAKVAADADDAAAAAAAAAADGGGGGGLVNPRSRCAQRLSHAVQLDTFGSGKKQAECVLRFIMSNATLINAVEGVNE